MPQLSNLVLKDRAPTPVDHTYVPVAMAGGVATLAESSGVPIGDNRLSVSMGKTQAGRYKATIKGVFPVIQNQTINGITAPTVVRTAYAELTFSFDGTSTEQERKDAVGLIQSSLDGTKWLNDVLVKLQGIY